MDQVQQLSAKIIDLVREAPGGTMLGVRLGASLRVFFPAFNPYMYRCRNLRHFIQTYVPDVSERGRSGADIVYTTVDATRVAAPITIPAADQVGSDGRDREYVRLPTTAYNWKAYSNPGHPFVVAVDREHGTMQSFPEDSTPGEPWVVLPKPTAQYHSLIAKEFASTLQEPLQTNLSTLLSDPKWYVRFSSVAMRHGLGPRWGAFRRAKLIDHFNSSLRELSVPVVPRGERTPDNAVLPPPPKAPALSASTATEESEFRDLVSRVVSELPLGELRSLKLPVGAVFDALKR
jgi:hypothetical protein